VAAIAAATGYGVVAVGSLTAYRQAATSSFTFALPVRIPFPRGLGVAASAVAWFALASLTSSIAFRWAAVGRPPLGNLWEYTVALGWGITLFTLLFEIGFRERTLSAFMMPLAAGLMAVALVFFPSDVRPLTPALQANRILGMHVATMTLAYSALSISFGSSLMYVLQSGGGGRRFSRLPDTAVLGDIAYWSVLVGFPLLTLGIALGAYWASSAWGRYWGWDPKETSALLTWFIYAGYLHARGLRGWEGKRAAWLLVIGFGAVLFTYFAVNFLISGLHSYAGV